MCPLRLLFVVASSGTKSSGGELDVLLSRKHAALHYCIVGCNEMRFNWVSCDLEDFSYSPVKRDNIMGVE